jgi:hypothetical protein
MLDRGQCRLVAENLDEELRQKFPALFDPRGGGHVSASNLRSRMPSSDEVLDRGKEAHVMGKRFCSGERRSRGEVGLRHGKFRQGMHGSEGSRESNFQLDWTLGPGVVWRMEA